MGLAKATDVQTSSAAARQPGRVTLRAVALGLTACAIISAWITSSRTVVNTSAINITHLPISFFAVFLVITTANFLLRTRPGRVGLVPSELLTVLAMGLVAGMIPSRGLTGIWLGVMAAPYYLGTPENGWIDLVQPNLPSYLFPTNEGNQISMLYEGLPPGAAIPWNVWIVPIFWWLTLILAGFTVCMCIVVILRKHWMEHERLDYPLTAPIVELIDDSEGSDGRARWPDLIRGRLFWAGFAIAFGIIAWNCIAYFYPNWPRIDLTPYPGMRLYFARHFPPLLTIINTYTIGFGYFVKLEILFSIWFFHLVMMTEIAVTRKTGFQPGGGGGGWGAPLIQWQCLGALFVFVGWGLWTARRHLKAVFRRAFYGDPAVDDSAEMFSYRTAVTGLVLGNLYIVAWLYQAGVALRLIAITIPASIVIYIALARFVCESGTLYLSIPTSALDVGYHVLGTDVLSGQTITAASTSHALNWMLFMPALSQGAKAADRIRGSRRPLFWALVGGLLVALAVNIGMFLYLGYTHGAYNFPEYPFNRYAPSVYDSIVYHIRSPEPVSWWRVLFFGVGGAIMVALTALRYRFPGWPLHPVGFIITTTCILHEILSLFIVWMFKSIVMRVGGAQLYRRLRPFFFGMVIGRVAGVLLSSIIDWIWFYGSGHAVHGWR